MRWRWQRLCEHDFPDYIEPLSLAEMAYGFCLVSGGGTWFSDCIC